MSRPASHDDTTLRRFALARCNAVEVAAFTGWHLSWARIRLTRARQQISARLPRTATNA